LSFLRAKHVILYFYPRDDTPGCTKEACGFRDAWKEIGKLNATVLGVSADGEASHQKFIAKYRLPLVTGPTGCHPLDGLIGPDGKVRRH